MITYFQFPDYYLTSSWVWVKDLLREFQISEQGKGGVTLVTRSAVLWAFERSYTLEGSAGEHRPEVIRAILGRMLPGKKD